MENTENKSTSIDTSDRSIHSLKSIGFFIFTLIYGIPLMTYIIIPKTFLFFSLKNEESGLLTIYDIEHLSIWILGYILVASSICLFVSIIKKLKSRHEHGLISQFADGLFIATPILGLVFGLINVFTSEGEGLIDGFFYLLIGSLTGGLITGLIFEFKKIKKQSHLKLRLIKIKNLKKGFCYAKPLFSFPYFS